ncbi:MAG TPA: hypothetical protein VFS90_20690 [Pyrinomonadaceae bacterium]|nr:hypothetical protein [Pyrinomonadaceae bacterium]
MMKAYYHAAIDTVTAILCNWAVSALKWSAAIYFVKLVGSEKTVTQWNHSFLKLRQVLRV